LRANFVSVGLRFYEEIRDGKVRIRTLLFEVTFCLLQFPVPLLQGSHLCLLGRPIGVHEVYDFADPEEKFTDLHIMGGGLLMEL
jgi:hypothetical protein